MSTSAPAPATLDVSEVIDNSAIRPLHIALFALCLLCMIVDGFDVQALGYAAPAIIQEWRIAPALLGPVFGAGNFGVLVGQLSLAVLADRVGRRPVLIGGALFFGVTTLATAWVVSIPELLAVRFVAGMGLGSIVPNITALISEFSPRKRRIALLTWIGTGYTAGAAIGGFLAAWMIPRFGWPSVFYLGGAIPLVLAVLMFIWLPESLKLLVLRDRNSPKDVAYIAKWLHRVDPRVHVTSATTLVVLEENRSAASVMGLFRDGRATATATVLGGELHEPAQRVFAVELASDGCAWRRLFDVYRRARGDDASSRWYARAVPPRLARRAARFHSSADRDLRGCHDRGRADRAAGIAAGGARGGRVRRRSRYRRGATDRECVVGDVLSDVPRSTGLGWGLGIGRAGAIVGPVVAGWFIALQWSTHAIFLALAVPALISTVFVFALRRTMVLGSTSA